MNCIYIRFQMKKITTSISIFILIFCNSIFSQSTNDSIKQKIDNYPTKDTILVEMIIDYCINQTFDVSSDMLKYSNKSLELSRKLKYINGEIRSLNNIGNYYYQLSIYEKAVEFYNQALNKSIQNNSINNIIISKSNLASLYTRTKETNKAIKLFIDCDSILVNRGDSIIQNRAALLVNYGNALSADGKHSEAVKVYLKAYNICNKLEIPFGIILSLSNMASEYVFMKDFKNAMTYLKKAEEIAIKNKAEFFLTQIYMNMGLSYSGQHDDASAIKFLRRSIEYCKKTGDNQTLVNVLRNIHSIYIRNGNKDDAYQSILNYTKLNDSLIGEEKQKIINELNIKYDTQRKEFSINQLEKDKQIIQLQSFQKSIIIYVIIIVSCLLLAISYFLFTRYKTKKQNELLKTKLEDAELLLIEKQKASDSEIKAIKSQMNPHFFYNALNSIQGYIYSGDKENAAKSLGLFSDLSRSILESSRNTEISLHDEIELLQNYLKLETMRLPKITYRIHVSETINLYDVYIPAMILQPLVENAIKHGLANKQGEGLLSINVEEKNNKLFIDIEDDGIGREAASEIGKRVMKKSASFSTDANMSRIELLNANKTEKITQEIIDKKIAKEMQPELLLNL